MEYLVIYSEAVLNMNVTGVHGRIYRGLPMLQISVLLPLMENRKLIIPGREDCIEVAPGFQFFATRR